MNIGNIITIAISVIFTAFLGTLCGYKIFQYYVRQLKYHIFLEDLLHNRADNLILRFSSDFWFNAFKNNADRKTINLVLRCIGHAVYNGSSLETRPHVIGTALGKIATLNKKCEVRAIQYCTSLAVSTNNPYFVIALMEENPKISGKKFVSLLKQFSGEVREDFLKHLQNDPEAKKLLILL